MAEYILLIDSNDEEAEGFVRGLEEATASPWEVELYPNNTTYGLRRYLKFFTVALHVVTHPARYSGKTLLCWQQFYGIAIAFFCRLFHLKKRFRLVIMTFIYKPRSGFAGRLFERFVRYAVTSDAVDRILLTTRAEAPRYAETFGLPLSRFGFAHCGSIPHDPAAYDDPALKAQGYYFATGRSNRDYDFLIRASGAARKRSASPAMSSPPARNPTSRSNRTCSARPCCAGCGTPEPFSSPLKTTRSPPGS